MLADSSHQTGQTVGARMRAARLAKKYTQNQLARPDFSVSYISAIERGQIQPSLRALEILARRLELSTTDLLPAHSALVGTSLSSVGGTAVGSEEQELLLLEAQIAIHQRKPAYAIEILQGLLPQKSERRQERGSALYYVLGWAHLEAGHLQESEQLLAEASHLARESTDPFYLRVLSLQGAVYTAMHNTEQAVQMQRERLRALAQQAETDGNVFFLAQLHSSLAQHHNYLGEYEQAIEQFQQTLHLLQMQNSCQRTQENYWKLISDYTEKGLYALAILYGSKWLLSDLRCRLAGVRNGIEYALGKALLQSDPEQAHSYLLGVSQDAEARQDSFAQAGANIQLACWLVARGELSQAEQLVHLAQKQAAPFGDTLTCADIQLLAGELAYLRQDYIVGDHCFEEGLAILEQVGAHEDLSAQLAHYAQLLEERNCIQKSILYWKRAYESRQKHHMLSL
jgi:transcriptional regulator with XRE-family HTH domain